MRVMSFYIFSDNFFSFLFSHTFVVCTLEKRFPKQLFERSLEDIFGGVGESSWKVGISLSYIHIFRFSTNVSEIS